MNICPVCRNVNQPDVTVCRFCGTTLTPPRPDAPVARRRPLWPWLAGALALVLVVSVSGFAFFGGGGEEAAAGTTVVVGTDDGAALLFVPESVTAPPETEVELVFNNQATVPHNLTFPDTTPIDAATQEQLPAGQSETLNFTTPAPGTYPFVCTIHPGMDGTLVVQ